MRPKFPSSRARASGSRGARTRISRTRAAAAVVLGLGFLAAVARLCVDGPAEWEIALVFAVVIAIGETMRITLPGGRDNAPLSATACLGYALTYRVGGHPAVWGAPQVVVVVAGAAVVGSLPQMLVGRPPSAGYLIRRVGITGVAAWPARTLLHSTLIHASHQRFLLIFSVLVCLALLLDSACAAVFAATASWPGLAAYQVSTTPEHPAGGPAVEAAPGDEAAARPEGSGIARRLRRFLAAWMRECAATARVSPAVAALSVAVALAVDPLGLWVLPIAAAPILVMQRALRRYAAIRATYQQTIRALSRITDLAGYTEPGHARRVCRLALAIGRELGLSEPELLDLECAALLHDLGQLSLADPLPGGATVTAAPEVFAEVAARGAEVVRQTGVLDRVARLVEAQSRPYTHDGAGGAGGAAAGTGPAVPAAAIPAAAGGAVAPDEARAAAILRAANDFEDLCNEGPGPTAYAAALARIRRGDGLLYDPQVVAALARLVRTF